MVFGIVEMIHKKAMPDYTLSSGLPISGIPCISIFVTVSSVLIAPILLAKVKTSFAALFANHSVSLSICLFILPIAAGTRRFTVALN